MFVVGWTVGVLAYLAWLSGRTVVRVEEGHVAVLTQFGAALHGPDKALKVLDPGLHFKPPWQKAIKVSVRELNLDLSGEHGGRAAMAEDGTVLRFDSILRVQPERATLERFLFDLRAPLEHITGLFTCLLRNEIANFRPDQPGEAEVAEAGGSYALIRRERRDLNARIEAFCRARISGNYGVYFNAVDLTDILPPDELADALNAVMKARQEAQAALNHAQAECTQEVLAAQRGVEIATARAAAAETEIDTLGQALAELEANGTLDAYVARRRAEVEAQSRMLFLRRDA